MLSLRAHFEENIEVDVWVQCIENITPMKPIGILEYIIKHVTEICKDEEE